jgi:hypothetical protein
MALTTRGKILYGIAFLLLVPLALIGWAFATSSAVGLPAVKSAPLGLAAMLTGALLLLAGMRDLWRFGGGLPMNAHPPARFVDRGAYRWHSMFGGFDRSGVGQRALARFAGGDAWLHGAGAGI